MGEGRDEVAETIFAFVRERFPVAGSIELTHSTSLLGSGIVDSLGVLNLVEFVEEEFGVTAGDDDLVPENFDSVDALARFVIERR